MNKKVIVIVLLIALVFTASYLYFSNRNEDTSLINKVVEIEKNLVLAQLHEISFQDFKGKTSGFIHPYYSNEFFERIEKQYNSNEMMVVSTKLPLYQDVSKVYTSEDGANKFVFVKIAVEGIENLAAERVTFIKDDGEWKVRNIGSYVLSKDMKRPIKDVETFTSFNDTPIEYESIRILNNL